MNTQIGRTKRAKMTLADAGSVSQGTLVTEDLAESFFWELKHHNHPKAAALQAEWDAMDHDPDGEGVDYGNDEDFLNGPLFDAMQKLAKPYFYFGAHPGDGEDFGFWLEESFGEDFDGLKVSDTSEVPKGYTGEVLDVNDHGNMTLYSYSRGRSREVWAIV